MLQDYETVSVYILMTCLFMILETGWDGVDWTDLSQDW
jgi:hypothetical protein